MEIKSTVEGTTATFVVEGKLTVKTSPDLSAEIEKVPAEVTDLVVDLTDVGYVSSAGLRVFVAADKMATRRGGRLHLLHPADEVYEVFDMTGLSGVLDIER